MQGRGIVCELSSSVRDLPVVSVLAPRPGVPIMERSGCMGGGLSWGIGQIS